MRLALFSRGWHERRHLQPLRGEHLLLQPQPAGFRRPSVGRLRLLRSELSRIWLARQNHRLRKRRPSVLRLLSLLQRVLLRVTLRCR